MSEVIQRTAEEVEDIAANLGLECIYPLEDELILDIDVKGGKYRKDVMKCLLDSGYSIIDTKVTISKSGYTHIYIRLNEAIDPDKKIAIQAALGSDPVKEALSVIRRNQGNYTAASVLFEKPIYARAIKKWREKLDSRNKNKTAERELFRDVY